MQTVSSVTPNENWQEMIGNKKGRCLDFGCGYGADANWFAEHGWQVDALDYNDEIKFQHPNLNFIKADFRRIDLTVLGKYDLIISCSVFHYFKTEYALDLVKVLLTMLNPGGWLYLKLFEEYFTPQWEDFFNYLNARIDHLEENDDHPPMGKHTHKIVRILCQR
jgi:SAM-dependent methyltransferase